MSLYDDEGTPFAGDPRHALSATLDRYAQRGWSVVAATELEFTLVDASGPKPQPPTNPITGRRLSDEAVLSVAEMDAFEAFFTDLYNGCAEMDIPAQTAISESGIGPVRNQPEPPRRYALCRRYVAFQGVDTGSGP